MAASNYSILPVMEADLPFLAEFIHAAKLRLTINRLLFEDWPNDPVQTKMYTNAVRSGFKDPDTEGFKAVDNNSKEIVGYFVLARKRPSQKPPQYEIREISSQGTPEGLNPLLFAEVMAASAKIEKEVEGTDHFDLVYICVKPSLQGHGIGAKLVQIGFDKAKDDNIPFALCAEAPAHNFYVKLGFKETKHTDIDLAKYAQQIVDLESSD
ncbi:hypothetical protein N7450_009486 [Penicillium hetheringtonii]|uniref:N-acetyltransferase domain-containing protein n=1 Tax=Penicillium hetheringtonii TaxID=911720 RepID=A0AAD6DB06_9EURO|nr:hypothetical protein N7450_009486 [Penicillium hetheringtonii]